LLFFELEFNKLQSHTQNSFINSSEKYSYYLTNLKEEKKHQLSQKEERLLIKKDQTGVSAFSRLFDEHFSKMKFLYDGKQISEETILSLLSDSNRDVRKKASESFTKELKKHQHLLAYIFNMIRADLKIDCELRGYKSAEEPRHKDNKISQKSVDALIKAAQNSFGIVHRYYEKKREILGFDRLYDYDRYAPINSKDDEFSFEDSKKNVLDAFETFSPKFANIAKKAFEEGWIDVYPKENKQGGAFSHPATTNTHPYILLNHTNKRRDFFTLAHELGHAIHQYLAKDVGYLASDTPLTTAETASVFAEMLVFDKLKETLNKQEKKALLASKIEDIFATLYRQINFTTFERAVHSHDGELSLDEFNSFWIQESKKMFGKSVELTKNYQIWWSYMPHFIHSPFYCYAYSYGQLLVLALYGLYKSEKMVDFVEKYEKFLSAGGSKSPKELVGYFGFDIEDEKFWQIGLDEVKKLVDEFEEL
jgi:oligoendopeptidase F